VLGAWLALAIQAHIKRRSLKWLRLLDFPAVTYSPVTPTVTVPSALEGLTAVFGMGTGVTPPL
jgi:hypothetical protein